jgi:predicted transcriptional regulator
LRIERATGIKHTTISKLLNELCDKYQIIGRENYMKNRKRYFFNYLIDGVLTSEKRAAHKVKSILTKTEVQNNQVSQKTDFLCTKQIYNLIKDISEKKSFETLATSKSSETVTKIETTIAENRVDNYKEFSIKKNTMPNPSEPIKEKEIDLNFLEELKRLRPGYHHQSNVT